MLIIYRKILVFIICISLFAWQCDNVARADDSAIDCYGCALGATTGMISASVTKIVWPYFFHRLAMCHTFWPQAHRLACPRPLKNPVLLGAMLGAGVVAGIGICTPTPFHPYDLARTNPVISAIVGTYTMGFPLGTIIGAGCASACIPYLEIVNYSNNYFDLKLWPSQNLDQP